jgi:hypothetical protein
MKQTKKSNSPVQQISAQIGAMKAILMERMSDYSQCAEVIRVLLMHSPSSLGSHEDLSSALGHVGITATHPIAEYLTELLTLLEAQSQGIRMQVLAHIDDALTEVSDEHKSLEAEVSAQGRIIELQGQAIEELRQEVVRMKADLRPLVEEQLET